MGRPLLLFFSLVVTALHLSGQDKITELKTIPGFSKNNHAAGYFIKENSHYHLIQQEDSSIHRSLLDSNFNEVNSYSFTTDKITFNRKRANTPVFVADLQIRGSVYEVYSDKNTIVISSIDFTRKSDSIVYTLQLTKEEQRLAVMPFSGGVRILSFSKKKDLLTLYKWEEGKERDSVQILLPESSLSGEEVKKYTKDARIKYKSAFDNMTVNPADRPVVIATASANGIFYTDQKIWLITQTPYFTGYNIIGIDLATYHLHNANIMLNDMRRNNTVSYENVMKPFAAVLNNLIIIRNASFYRFEYHIYEVETKKLLKEYKVEPDGDIKKIVHSDLNQKGTWLSANDEKKLDNEKAFLRKLSAGDGFISMAGNDGDSITVTSGSIMKTTGIEGVLLMALTSELGYMANITIGNYQVIPYLTVYRNKLIYCHSRFSKQTLEPSTSSQVSTYLDILIDNFERKDLKSKSSFILNKHGKLSLAVFNKDSKKFEVFKLLDEQK